MQKEGLTKSKPRKIKNLKSSISSDDNNAQQPVGLIKHSQRGHEQHLTTQRQNRRQKQKLIDQNIRLKTQIFDLSRQLDEIMERQEKKIKNYGTFNDQEDDQNTKNKKIQLRKQQLEVLSLKNKIHQVKRQLETVYNNRNLLAKEDQLKFLKNQLQNLQQQKKSLLKIKKQQSKALKVLKNQEEYADKIDQLKKQLSTLKEQSRSLNQNLVQSERILRKNHEQYITKQAKVKQLQQKLHLQQNKSHKNNKNILEQVTEEMISQLESEIIQLEKKRKDVQKNWHDKINAIDAELRQKKMEEEKKLMLLKEKEKQLKLNQLKIKQLRKLIKCNITEKVVKQQHQDVDMSKYRNKRNIKYMRQ